MRIEKIIYFITLLFFGLVYLLKGASGAGILLIVTVVYGILALAISRLSGDKLRVTFSLKGEIEKDSVEKGNIRITNESAVPVFRMNSKLLLKNLLTGEEKEVTEEGFGIGSRKTEERDYELGDRYSGKLILEMVDAEITDPLGVFRRRVKPVITSSGDQCIYVLPELEILDISPEELERYDMESYKYADSKVGNDSSETVGIKGYEEGDNIRTIHWKLSAKAGETMVRELGLPIDNRLMIVFDKSISSSDERAAEIDRYTDYFASISFSLVKKGMTHSIGWYEEGRQEYIYKIISTEDDVMNWITEFISLPFSSEGYSGVDRYLEADVEKNFASFILIGPNWELDEAGLEIRYADSLNRLREYGFVSIYSPEKKE